MYETVLSTLDAKGVRTITLNRPKAAQCHEPAITARSGGGLRRGE